MLTKIEVSNIGPFNREGVTIELKPLTILIGANNVGKSTVIYAYDVLSSGYFPSAKFKTYKDLTSMLYMQNPSNEGRILVTGKFNNVTFTRHAELSPQSVSITDRINGEVVSTGVLRGPITTTTRIREESSLNQDELMGLRDFQSFFGNTTVLLSDRVFISGTRRVEPAQKELMSDGSNIIQYLLERWTDRDEKWKEAEDWLKQIDPQLSILKTPLHGLFVSIETERTYPEGKASIDVSNQGSGIQRLVQMISALVFSPENTLIIIEEPEMNLHKKAQEILANLINKAVQKWKKQVIVTTHSWDFLLPYMHDLGILEPERKDSFKIKRENMALCELLFENGKITVRNDAEFKKFSDFKSEMKKTLG